MKNFLFEKKDRKYLLSKNNFGFTLMEIMVATMLFAIITVSLLSLFNYVLKINRRSEALRQSSQGMRNFMEFLVKEIRNGQIDYYASGGNYTSGVGPCNPPGTSGNPVTGAKTYYLKENKLGLINSDNVQECFYYADANSSYVDAASAGAPTIFSSSTGGNLVLEKSGVIGKQVLNPPNFQVQSLVFLIRPLCDPGTSSCVDYGNSYPHTQPSVTIMAKFVAKLPTGEQSVINYQTSVSSLKYDIP